MSFCYSPSPGVTCQSPVLVTCHLCSTSEVDAPLLHIAGKCLRVKQSKWER